MSGTLPFLADHAVVEVPARVGRRGSRAAGSAPVDPLLPGSLPTYRRTRSWHSTLPSRAGGNGCSAHCSLTRSSVSMTLPTS